MIKTTKRLMSLLVILGILIKLYNFELKVKSKEGAKWPSLVSAITEYIIISNYVLHLKNSFKVILNFTPRKKERCM